jgi:hypothetical protein
MMPLPPVTNRSRWSVVREIAVTGAPQTPFRVGSQRPVVIGGDRGDGLLGIAVGDREQDD